MWRTSVPSCALRARLSGNRPKGKMTATREKISRALWAMAPLLGAMIAVRLLLVEKPLVLVPFAAAILGGTLILILPLSRLLAGYFVYLMFDGALKIWSNYNPVL